MNRDIVHVFHIRNFSTWFKKNFPNLILVPYRFDTDHSVYGAEIDCCFISQKATVRPGMTRSQHVVNINLVKTYDCY